MQRQGQSSRPIRKADRRQHPSKLKWCRSYQPQKQKSAPPPRSKQARIATPAQATGEQTKVSRSQYDAAKAAIGQSEASVKDAQLQLSYRNITDPAAGQIGRKSVELGQRV